MNILDILILVPIAWGAFKGFRKGFVIEVASLLALALGIFGSVRFSYLAGQWLNAQFEWSAQAIRIVSFVLTFIVIVFLVHAIARGVEKLVKMVALGTINRIFGAVFGMLKWLIIVACLFYVADAIDHRYPFIGKEKKEKSLMYDAVVGLIPFIYPHIKAEFKEEDQSFIAAMPGSSMPSRYSIKAPPPVET